MSLSAWLCTAFFVLSALGLGVFRKSWELASPAIDLCHAPQASPMLCGKKIALRDATPGDFALVDGISLESARRIVIFVANHDQKKLSVDDLERVKGIGPKRVKKLKEFFY